MTRLGAAAVAALFVVLALGACAGEGGSAEPALERVRREGVVRVGFANEAPYAYLDSRTDRLTGEAPEIARAVLERMGVPEIEGVLAEFGALIPGLKAGRFDMIAAGMYVKPARCREIDFSNPTYCIGEGLLVRAGNPLGLHSYDDVRDSEEARIGVVAGAVELGYAREVGVPEDRIVIFPDAPSAVAGVQSGRIDGYAGTSLTVKDMLTKADDPRLAPAEPFRNPVIDGEEARGCGAFGFRPGDDAFREAFDRHLEELLGTPEHLELVRPFGFSPDELPGGVTAEGLCAAGAA
ncbi:MAG TPA: ectoine/hydroxyectoine ABC transporter substrate-binding protein EhuB [Thermoanaerobaculia bacterium]